MRNGTETLRILALALPLAAAVACGSTSGGPEPEATSPAAEEEAPGETASVTLAVTGMT